MSVSVCLSVCLGLYLRNYVVTDIRQFFSAQRHASAVGLLSSCVRPSVHLCPSVTSQYIA